MIRILFVYLLFFTTISIANAQRPLREIADSISLSYQVPALCYAVISADSILDIQYLGVRRAGTSLTIGPGDRFRIGSNTKAITALIAAGLVHCGKIGWDTKFMDLLPEMRDGADRRYMSMTLYDLLSFHVAFPSYTYTDAEPAYDAIEGNAAEAEARRKFVKWFLDHKPAAKHKGLYQSNVSYCAAGLMLERATGHSYPQLVDSLGSQLGIFFAIGTPNATDSTQTWGHTGANIPQPPGADYKLNRLLAAGNINMTLSDYARFIQIQLRGLRGEGAMLSVKEFEKMHYSPGGFALGWYCDSTITHHLASHNLGNPGSYTSEVYVIRDIDRAYIILTNAQNEATYQAVDVMMKEMMRRYGE